MALGWWTALMLDSRGGTEVLSAWPSRSLHNHYEAASELWIFFYFNIILFFFF
jgi:hypothetical protein